MFESSSWKHLRIPFSYYLMPVFLFALALSTDLNGLRVFLVWSCLHLFLYPSSNGYNSYFDKDEESIGGLKNPPKVSLGLYYLSLLFFLISLFLAMMINLTFLLMVLVYGLVSMAYSHPSIRLKKYPYLSWLTAGFFQGCFTFLMCFAGLNHLDGLSLFLSDIWFPGILTSVILLGSYPLTQVYQHGEDSKRGDLTLSIKLGIIGTFSFAAIWFFIAGIAFATYFYQKNELWAFYAFLIALTPVMLYFFIWFTLVKKDSQKYANHTMAMWMNKISGTALNLFFIYYATALRI